MTICGHQFHGGDGSDWVFSTSVGCLDGSTTASRILQELFKKHCRSLKTETSRKRPKTLKTFPENISPSKSHADTKRRSCRSPPVAESEETLIVRKMPGASSTEHFDASQHLSGCPMKWLHERRMLEKNKRFKVGRLCTKQSPRREESKKEKGDNHLRDRTPVEVKIHKINLTEKYSTDSDLHSGEGNWKELEARRKKLAAKLNWKLHDESQDDRIAEASEHGSRHDYFPPRPLLGLKPLLSVLLAPHKTNCACLETQLRAAAPPQTARKPSLSVQLLDLPLTSPAPHPRPKTSNALRWGSKSSAYTKKLQIPNQITIKLDQKKHKSPEKKKKTKPASHNPPGKRACEQKKQTKSLSCLFYELRGKTNENEQVFEELMRDLTTEGQFKIKRFFNFTLDNSDSGQKRKATAEKKTKAPEDEPFLVNESNIVCAKVRFFRKILPRESKTRSCEAIGSPQKGPSTRVQPPPLETSRNPAVTNSFF